MSLTPGTFDWVRHLVHERSAIVLDDAQGYLVETRLQPLARSQGAASVDVFVNQLREAPYGSLHAQLVEAMTTTETSFFRDFHPFELIRTQVLPERLGRAGSDRQLALWSSACSSGQEAYSLAMLLQDLGPRLTDWNLQVVASDISSAMLARAKEGVYSQAEINRGLPAAQLVKHFTKHGADWQVKEELRRTVRFLRLGLNDSWPALPRMDLVLMRNVLIYFDVETRRRILEKTRRVLKDGGYLFVGTAEMMIGLEDGFERLRFDKTMCFRRKG